MARQTRLDVKRTSKVLFRLASPETSQLLQLMFRRYPHSEWGTLCLLGWRESEGCLLLTLASLIAQERGDLDETVENVAFLEPYTLRSALMVEKHHLAIGVVHSHPRGCHPAASRVDDAMDEYYAEYFGGFAPERPYVSLIVSEIDGGPVIAGRAFWKGQWSAVTQIAAERGQVTFWSPESTRSRAESVRIKRTERLADAFGDEAAERLRASSVAVIGAGGTGSAAIEVLTRAGVGRLVIVDPDSVEESNLERIHGSVLRDATARRCKVEVARDHVRSIDAAIRVEAFVGALPQREVVDAVVTCDVALGCTDQQHSRLALSELCYRYLLPALDVGVTLEGGRGRVTGQCLQIVRFLSADPCAICSRMISFDQVTQELMSDEERASRRNAARAAVRRGGDGNAYWRELPQINTVGYLTTAGGSMAAAYAIGWLARRFDPPFSRLQLNFVAPFLDVTDDREKPSAACTCRSMRGWADQGAHGAVISVPTHWPPVRRLDSAS